MHIDTKLPPICTHHRGNGLDEFCCSTASSRPARCASVSCINSVAETAAKLVDM